jgi:hypothetical protein
MGTKKNLITKIKNEKKNENGEEKISRNLLKFGV